MAISIIVGSISLATVFLFGCVGEIITEKSGHLNLGIPGIMCSGTAGGCFGVATYMNTYNANPSWFVLVLFSVICSIVFAAIVGGIYAILTVSLRCNQNITGLAITTFGTGFTQFFIDNYVDKNYFDKASRLISQGISVSKLGWFGEIFLSYGILVYFAIALAVIVSIFLKKTRVGLHLRSIGENPATADAVGINVGLYKYVAILVGSGIAGLGGFFYIIDYIGGSWENASTIEALGWLSIALVIFTLWKPDLAILGSIIFACFYIIAFKITGVSFTVMAELKLLPYIVTIVVLILTSIFGGKSVQPPASLGLNYFREER
ncbi:MAG: ABC transporter permease [Clostridia bacterium]|nr:ABC transporter permease [Clostridia bacterium]MBQ9514095.1 ABC transporter permease [Clostridia bacterium]